MKIHFPSYGVSLAVISLVVVLVAPCVLGGLLWRKWRQQARDYRLIVAIHANNVSAVAASLKAGANAIALDSGTPPVSLLKMCQAYVQGNRPKGSGTGTPAFLVEPTPTDCGDDHHHITFPGKTAGIVKLLLNYGADIDAQDEQGCTELMRAVDHGQEDVVRLLLQRKARLDIKDQGGDTAFVHACMNGQIHFANLLRHAEAKK